jgi:hypothetical protein
MAYGEKPARPTAPKPLFTRKDSLGRDQYIAQFTFEGEQSGDLSFKKGDIIEVTKSSGSRNVLQFSQNSTNDRTGGLARLVIEQEYFLQIIWQKSRYLEVALCNFSG